ncbi:hypothetical protein C5A79_08190 [Neisseria gonorrhoeae]
MPSIRQTYPTYSCFESSFPRRRESRSVGAETYRIKRLLQSRVPDSHFRGNDGRADSVAPDKCRNLKSRHSRAGGNLGLSVRKLIG